MIKLNLGSIERYEYWLDVIRYRRISTIENWWVKAFVNALLIASFQPCYKLCQLENAYIFFFEIRIGYNGSVVDRVLQRERLIGIYSRSKLDKIRT